MPGCCRRWGKYTTMPVSSPRLPKRTRWVPRSPVSGEPVWLQGLARVYAQTSEKDKLIAVLKELLPTDADDFENRKKLAGLLGDEGKWAEAEKYAREALEIDLSDAEIQATLDKALREQKKDD